MSKDKQIAPFLGYDSLTPLYDSMVTVLGFGTKRRSHTVGLLGLKPGDRLLDIGCGTGSLLRVAKQRHPAVEMTGLDPDRRALDIARRKLANSNLDIELVKASAASLPFTDGSYDIVVSSLAFHHFSTRIKVQALQEIYRILRNDGRFLLVDFGKATGLVKILYRLEVLLRVAEAKTMRDNVDGLIPGLLEDAGFVYQTVASRYRGIDYLLVTKMKK